MSAFTQGFLAGAFAVIVLDGLLLVFALWRIRKSL
jgi:hypothetical protein